MKNTPYLIISLSAILALAVLLIYFYQTSPEVTDVPLEKVEETVDETQQPAALNEADTEAGITLARVGPDGNAVIAGNAPRGSTVNIYNNETLIGSTLVTESGEWVIVPEQTLPPGAHLLTLEIINPDGTVSVGTMALAIEIPAVGEETPLVALVPYTDERAEAQILQTPESVESVDDSADSADSTIVPLLTIRSIQALSPDTMSVSGRAEGGASVLFSVNGLAGEVIMPDDDSLYGAILPIDAAKDSLRLAGVLRNADGAEVASASVTLNRGQVENSLGNSALIVVQKGDALWRIAYKTYGHGIRYVDIYRQNQNIINDPDLIYPDQVFIIPNS